MNDSIKKLLVACVAALALLASATASSAWYRVSVDALSTNSDTGDTLVRFLPGKNTTAFTGAARGLVVASDDGATEILALILTAIALGKEVRLEMANVPSGSTQVIRQAGLILRQ